MAFELTKKQMTSLENNTSNSTSNTVWQYQEGVLRALKKREQHHMTSHAKESERLQKASPKPQAATDQITDSGDQRAVNN